MRQKRGFHGYTLVGIEPIPVKYMWNLQSVLQKRNQYFSKKGWHLVKCELPLLITPNPAFKNVLYRGYLDVVLYQF